MRITITGETGPMEVVAEKFGIAGAGNEFAVHTTMAGNLEHGDKQFSATHIATGMRIAQGDTLDSCITAARMVWQSKTPEELKAAISRAMALKNERGG